MYAITLPKTFLYVVNSKRIVPSFIIYTRINNFKPRIGIYTITPQPTSIYKEA